MTIRKRTARILRRAASKLDPPPSPREMARKMVRESAEALAAMPVNEFNLSRWLPTGDPDTLAGVMSKWDRDKPRTNMVNHGPEGTIGEAIRKDAQTVTRHIAERFE